MNAMLISGTEVGKSIESRLKIEVDNLKQRTNKVPGLGVVLIGDNPASKHYVATKEKVAARVGLESKEKILPADATMAEAEHAISELNKNEDIHGILLQLPVPAHLDASRLLDLISPEKDSDGLHPANQGLLAVGRLGTRPCTPLGAMKLIDVALAPNSSGVNGDVPQADLSGKKAVVIGRSILVGKPVAALLLERNATVTIVHSRTKNIEAEVASADIVVAALGKPEFVKGSWIKPGAVVIDVGINKLADGKLVGDVNFAEAAKVAGAITPVPGGVGPMTVIMLIQNTVDNFKRKHGIKS
jgi:methylenetetrahydrofolate dehydrogenase (NADP+)/methenyltetrahydrofolate cyclohydrolase